MAQAGVLEIQLQADVARIRADMDKVQGIVSRSARQMERALDSVRAQMAGLFSGASVVGFGMWIKSAIDFQDELNDLSKTTDLSVEKLGGIALMSKQTGSDLTGMAQAINKLTLEMGKAPEKFQKIGITAKDPLEAFKQLSDIFVSIEDPQLRAAVAAEALGKGWTAAAPALAEGSKQIDAMVKRGEELVGATTDGAIASDAFNDQLSEFQMALKGSSILMANSMLPLLTELFKGFTDVTDEVNKSDAGFNLLTETMRALIVIGGNVAFVIRGIGIEIGGIAAQAGALLRGDFGQIAQIRSDMVADAAKNRSDFDAWEQRIMTAGQGGQKSGGTGGGRRKTGGPSTAALRGFIDPDKKAGKDREAEEAFKRMLAALEEEEKIRAEINELLNEEQKEKARQVGVTQKMLEDIEFETQALSMSNAEREKAIALRELERQGVTKNSAAYQDMAGKITSAIEQRERTREEKQFSEDLHSDVKGALQRAFEDTKNPAKAFVDALSSTLYTRVSSKMAEALADAMLGKPGGAGGSAGAGLLGPILSGIGGMLGGGGGSSFGVGAAYMDGAFMHAGGIVGGVPSFYRPVNPAVFHGAPRFHGGGIVGDEVPIIAKRGEGVFTPEQMRSMGATNVTQNIMVGDFVDKASMREELRASEQRMAAGLRRASVYGR